MINRHQVSHFISHFFSAKRNGHGIHSPFAYALCEEVFYNHNGFYDFEELQAVRELLLKDPGLLDTGNFGAGSKTFRSGRRKVKHIAARGISSRLQSELLYKLINYLKYDTCLELGTSLGLNTLYMAKACSGGSVTSIEGSRALYTYAHDLAAKNKVANINFVNGDFDAVLPGVLERLKKTDLVYIDGNHAYEATLRYFGLVLPGLQPHSAVIFDDIYWSPEMTRAWEEIKAHAAVTLSIDCFYFGIVFFRQELKEKTHLKIYL